MAKGQLGWLPQGEIAVTQPEFGQRLKARRTALRMSQRELAGDFVTPSYISLLEAGSRVPTLDVVVYLGRMLDCSLEELLDVDVAPLLPSEASRRPIVFEQVLARSASEVGDHAQARRFLENALASARSDGLPERVVDVSLELQDTLRMLSEHQARLRLLEELAEVPLVQSAPELLLVVKTHLASVLRDLGQLREARRTAYGALTHLRQPGIGGTSVHVRLLGVLISVLCEAGELDQVEPLITEMLEVAGKLDWPGFVGRAHWVASMAYAQLGRPEEAREHFGLARDALAFPSMSLIDWLRFCRSAASVLLDIGDDLDSARQWIRDAETTSRMLGLAQEQAIVSALRARYELSTGNPQEALRLYEPLTSPDTPLAGLDLIYSYLSHANALHQTRELDKAIAMLRSAVELCEKGGSYQLAAQVWRQIDELTRERDTVLADDQP
ncbi:tetratricopeptide repeat protein [Micromonospora fiedleri]|uniref:Tetratricopeptide repeat protein n=1 Tax=Micromonospora fiedleri TaxID=1157498 RepID=A0ABS1UXT8_9ACTN|nr:MULTISPECIES: helix-turn-helix domain-containing protein [Micromonospora]MBL6279715.1 tetratricopeptide repeat protein [Micromonospora fiedleri]WSK40931.1 helix-turn-helix domain-containing protein [Micromonospora maris]